MTNPDITPAPEPPLRRWRLLLLATLAFALTGCLGASGPAERLFRLSDPAPPADASPHTAGKGIMVVEGFEARGALARQRTIIYRDLSQANETQYYPAAQWEEPPAVMVQAAIASCLDRAGLFEGVVRRDRRLRPHYSLVGMLDQLEQRVAGSCSDAMIRVEMTVIDEESNRVFLKGVYQAAEPAGSGRIEQVLPAFDRALSAICTALVDDLRRLKKDGKPSLSAQPKIASGPSCAR